MKNIKFQQSQKLFFNFSFFFWFPYLRVNSLYEREQACWILSTVDGEEKMVKGAFLKSDKWLLIASWTESKNEIAIASLLNDQFVSYF